MLRDRVNALLNVGHGFVEAVELAHVHPEFLCVASPGTAATSAIGFVDPVWFAEGEVVVARLRVKLEFLLHIRADGLLDVHLWCRCLSAAFGWLLDYLECTALVPSDEAVATEFKKTPLAFLGHIPRFDLTISIRDPRVGVPCLHGPLGRYLRNRKNVVEFGLLNLICRVKLAICQERVVDLHHHLAALLKYGNILRRVSNRVASLEFHRPQCGLLTLRLWRCFRGRLRYGRSGPAVEVGLSGCRHGGCLSYCDSRVSPYFPWLCCWLARPGAHSVYYNRGCRLRLSWRLLDICWRLLLHSPADYRTWRNVRHRVPVFVNVAPYCRQELLFTLRFFQLEGVGVLPHCQFFVADRAFVHFGDPLVQCVGKTYYSRFHVH